MIPSKAGSFKPTDIKNLGKAFDRTAVNQEYPDMLNNGASETDGMMGNIIVDGLQINYMAMWERSFRERHKTDVRLQMHVAGRRTAHGLNKSSGSDPIKGVHTGAIQPFVQNYIDQTKTTDDVD